MSVTRTGQVGRRAFLASLLYGTASVALANAPTRSLRPIQKPSDAAKRAMALGPDLIERAKLGGKVSYAVSDVGTGAILESVSPLFAHPPASVTKAVTALYGLETLGAGYRFKTRLMTTGSVSGGVLQGDLILAGGGDPTLSTDDLFDLAARVKLAGITAVSGKFIVYTGALPALDQIDPGQPIQVGYNPGIGGLNLNFNRAFLEWKRLGSDYTITMDGRTEKIRPEVSFARAVITDEPGPIFTYQMFEDRERWTVARKALGKGGGRWLPVRRPGVYAADVFRTVARSHGIALPAARYVAQIPEGAVVVAEHLSDRMEDICRGMLKFSTNLTAEVVGLTASEAGSLKGSGQAMAQWMHARCGTRRASFVDHSGLGDQTRVTPQEMLRLLNAPNVRETLAPILKEIPVRDDNGTPIQGGRVQVLAKTGTLNFVSGLAGYIDTVDGRSMSFAIFASDTKRRGTLARQDRERPRGAKSWNGRAKTLQQRLIQRWSVVHEA